MSPEIGSIYTHYKYDARYIVMQLGHIEKTSEACVVYMSLKDGLVWVRPLKEWFELVDSPRFKYHIPRFTLEKP